MCGERGERFALLQVNSIELSSRFIRRVKTKNARRDKEYRKMTIIPLTNVVVIIWNFRLTVKALFSTSGILNTFL